MSTSPSESAETDLKTKALRLLAGDIRQLRKARGLTLAGLASQLGRSVGWLSQVERGISLPSLADLRALANHFKVPVSFFLSPAAPDEKESQVVVRAEQRRKLAATQMGVQEELLSPDLGGRFEMIRCELAGGTSLPQPRRRAAEEAGYVVSGTFEVEIAGKWYSLAAGDSFCVRGETFRWRNPEDETAVVLWVISPPVC
ncbi:helix-turn-helix domain-containing protein [Chelativorans sp. AA-79]|uniref:helix-turn-helix domain-containing protein n=1 Tax=Chelativorans sp. AA-79 TaxID=3028735 RepID=UPI0023F8EC3E|nr:helix-turn-helix domain-containing protein [Chelativorans sp. AA-79]WEX11418.1 helix-turn-helix domain-containing protein [Chelativorans sp. AA-79]